jgi:hypothetical protein
MKATAIRFLYAVVIAPASFAQPPDDLQRQFDEADRRIVRLQPAAFSQLPRNVVRELQRRGCTIPQTGFTKEPHNVIWGEFAKSGQIDWAVLCSIKGVSTILIFWNGSANSPAELAQMEDRIFLQETVPGQISFSRGIGGVGKDFIIRHYDAYGGTKPPPIDHLGIEDSFVEKASVVWFFYSGKWLKLTGAD